MFGNFLFSKFLGNSIDEIADGRGFEPLLFHFQGDFCSQRPFSEGGGEIPGKTKKNLSQSYGRWIVGFDGPMTSAFLRSKRARKIGGMIGSGLVESQRLFSDEQIAVIKMPASLRWRTTRHSRMPRKSSSAVCRSRSSCFCRSRNGINTPQWSRQCNISQRAGISFQKSRLFCVQGGIS